MASRRHELNAYTFAKRRMLAAFVQPSATGSEENAPRPLRAVVPGVIIAVVILAAFGAWGMIKPAAPQGWDTPGEKVIIASESTTRYVVLKSKHGPAQLHPVLNMASAKLLLDPDKGDVVKVDESVLDSGEIQHGVTIGIPYAPDRLPDEDEAKAAKRWAVCQRPGGKESHSSIQKAAFVFAEKDKDRTAGAGQLHGGELLYVQGPDKVRYVVDKDGTAYPLDDDEHLLRAVVGRTTPQQVSKEWLDTLHKGHKVVYPTFEGVNTDAGVGAPLRPAADRVGMVIQSQVAGQRQYYIVLRGKVFPISDFMENLLIGAPALLPLGQTKPMVVNPAEIDDPSPTPFGDQKWPRHTPDKVNSASSAKGATNTICNVLHDVTGKGDTTLTTWAGTSFPAPLPTGSSSAYVTPGSGEVFRAFPGSDTTSGAVFLVTDTGLRYALEPNDDGPSCFGKSKKDEDQQTQNAKTRLGYENVKPHPVPQVWSRFLPTGPGLSTAAACQPQGS